MTQQSHCWAYTLRKLELKETHVPQCSFWLTSLCIIGSSFIPLIRTDSNVFFLMDKKAVVHIHNGVLLSR